LTAYKLIPLINSEGAYIFLKPSKQIKFHFSSYLHLLPEHKISTMKSIRLTSADCISRSLLRHQLRLVTCSIRLHSQQILSSIYHSIHSRQSW